MGLQGFRVGRMFLDSCSLPGSVESAGFAFSLQPSLVPGAELLASIMGY